MQSGNKCVWARGLFFVTAVAAECWPLWCGSPRKRIGKSGFQAVSFMNAIFSFGGRLAAIAPGETDKRGTNSRTDKKAKEKGERQKDRQTPAGRG